MADTYGGLCSEYCAAVNRTCVGAWEEQGDTCQVKYNGACDTSFGDTSDAICECSTEQQASGAPQPGHGGGRPSRADRQAALEAAVVAGQCVDNVAPLRQYGIHRCSDAAEWCGNEGVSNTCCNTCAPITDWCKANGVEEADWSVRAGLKEPVLKGLVTPRLSPEGLTCEMIKANGLCDKDWLTLGHGAIALLLPNGYLDASSLIANVSCPVACGVCPKGDGVHSAPRAPRLLGADWTCESAQTPGTGASEGQTKYMYDFTCPENDKQVCHSFHKGNTDSCRVIITACDQR